MSLPAPDGFRPCAIVPSRNHWRVAGAVVERLRAAGLPVFVIDDGSDPPARDVLAALHDPAHGTTVERLEVNQGKGGAVLRGFQLAEAGGFTHAVQVDADGQHDLDRLDDLLAVARRQPSALVTGVPVYDASIPKGRAIGRWVTHVWVWIETLSMAIRDSMCGFRVYPLGAVRRLVGSGARIGRRMDFDTEIMVRLAWQGVPIAELPVRVTYPADNTSNFDLWRDNVRISLMHTRLVCGMILRFPTILANRPKAAGSATHWAALAERGLSWGLRLSATIYDLLGRRACLALAAPIVLYFYATGTEQRRSSRAFLERALGRKPGFLDGYRHFLSFTGRMLDVFGAWTGGIDGRSVRVEHGAALAGAIADPRGAVLIVAHHGNVDLSRAVLDQATRARLVVLAHTRHAGNYNRVLADLNPAAALDILQVSELGPETAIALKERVERGDWVVIAGDRTPVGSSGRTSLAPFLGAPAAFSQGPYILAALLDCPVYLLFCRREGSGHRLDFEHFADRIELPRAGRPEALAAHVTTFATRLEHHVRAAPYQWYNFFDFWAMP